MIYEVIAMGDYFYFFSFVSSHIAVLFDASPFQQNPTTKMNFIIAILISSLIPSLTTKIFSFQTSKVELMVGLSVCVILSIASTLTIERVSPIKLDF
jgi:hypothetical protein